MVVNVEIISKEMIKPSSPTPNHLSHHKLSFLDQIAPPVYVPMILFYGGESGHHIDLARKSQSLKGSLSDTLTQFYPLAGRIENDHSVDCSDAGVEYVEAYVHAHLSQVIENPNFEELKEYLPIQPYGTGAGMGKEALLAIKINFFECGGIAIGVCISHKIADGSSLVTFITAWASITRGASEFVQPNFDLALHYFPQVAELSGFMPAVGITEEKIVTKRLVFDKTKLDKLKEASSSAVGSQVSDPTPVEAVSSFIWRHVMEASSRLESGTKKVFAATHAVNLRRRMKPPVLDHSFGNFWAIAFALSTSEAEKGTYQDLLGELRSAIKKIDSDYIERIQSRHDQYLEDIKRGEELFSKGNMEFCNFSSWCRFPVYEVDYGWGKPLWVCLPTLPYKNVVILMSTRGGDGMEALVNMLEEDMAVLERDHELLTPVATSIA